MALSKLNKIKKNLSTGENMIIDKAVEIGFEKGFKDGRLHKSIEVIFNGKKEGLSNEMLYKLTKLSIKKIEQLIEENTEK